MSACYIDSSFVAMIFLAFKYADSVERLILANANAGGENVARGALLGALIGAYHGLERFPQWSVEGLVDRQTIKAEIEGLLGSVKEDL